MKQFLLCTLVLALSLPTMRAQSVTPEEAATVAAAFLQSQDRQLARAAHTTTRDGHNLLYIFNSTDSYVVVSGDKRTPPVLAFSDHQLYLDSEVCPPARMWLDHYANQIEELQQSPTGTEHPAWNHILSQRALPRNGEAIAPLTHSHWSQEEFYNYYCPRDYAGPNNRCVTGCVATAMGQLMYYFRWPHTGTGSYSYTDENYGTQSADFGNTTYDYSAMCDNPNAINTEISKLIYHCGVGVDMHYGVNGSGMYNHSAAYVLRTYLKYSPETQYVFRDSTTLDWDSLIISHLERNIPLYYAGWSVPDINGHGFICDGYKIVDSAYYYHFNFGWGGSHDGYFITTHLNTAGTHFNLAQELIINAYPDTNQYAYPTPQTAVGDTTLTSHSGSFLNANVPSDYTWHIQPDVPNLEGIQLAVRFNLSANDTLYINPDNCWQPIIILTDTTGTLSVDWDCAEIMVHYHGSGAGQRFFASYSAQQPQFCVSYLNSGALSGTFDDGSGDDDYLPLTACQYKITILNRPFINLHFTKFDLEEDHDFLYIFYQTPSEENLLATYTGSMPDTIISFDKRRLVLVFESDEQNQGDGFEIEYEGSITGVQDIINQSFSVFPNPAHDVLNVESEQPIEEISLFNAMGQNLRNWLPSENTVQLNLSDLPAGVYFLKINTLESSLSYKFIKL